jgi:hypothetical protein
MTTKIIDTTVLTNALLKTGAAAEAARAALARGAVPHYAIKEFRCGPFLNFAYAHNVLAEEKSLSRARERIRRLSAQDAYRKRTSEEAFAEAEAKLYVGTMGEVSARFHAFELESGVAASADASIARQFRRHLRDRIDDAWRQSRKHEQAAVGKLSCFQNSALVEQTDGTLAPRSLRCIADCVLSTRSGGVFEGREGDIRALITVVDAQNANAKTAKAEHKNRADALRALVDRPQEVLSHDVCRHLGDAVFALLCPAAGAVITTNRKDHDPLTQALGRSAEDP